MSAFDIDTMKEAEYDQAIIDFIRANENTTGDYDAHFDGNDSVVIGYGLDLLKNDNATINQFLRDAGIPELTAAQATQLDNLRTNRSTMTD